MMHFRVAVIRYDGHAVDRIDGAADRAVMPMSVSTVPVHHVCAAAESHQEVEGENRLSAGRQSLLLVESDLVVTPDSDYSGS